MASELKVNVIVNASGDNDSGIDLATNDQVLIKTADTTAITVDASQRVGIGTTTPASNCEIESTGDTTLRITAGGTSNDSKIDFVHGTTTDGGITFDHNGAYASEQMAFRAGNNTPHMYLTGDGVLLVGQSTFNYANVGCSLTSSGQVGGTANGDVAAVFNRKTSDGEIINLRQDNSTIGGIYSSPSITGPFIGHINVGLAMYHNGNSVLPSGTGGLRDNAIDLGNGSNRFDDIFATNTTIQTSDRNEKQDIEELSEAEQRVAVVAKGLMRKYRWRDAVAEKGDNARTHFGIIAQDLQDAFTAEGLDASDYAMFCSDTWWEKEISVDAVEADEENGIEAQDAYTYRKIAEEATEGYTEKTRLGVRYNELLAFIISAL